MRTSVKQARKQAAKQALNNRPLEYISLHTKWFESDYSQCRWLHAHIMRYLAIIKTASQLQDNDVINEAKMFMKLEKIRYRRHIAGMHHTIKLMELWD